MLEIIREPYFRSPLIAATHVLCAAQRSLMKGA